MIIYPLCPPNLLTVLYHSSALSHFKRPYRILAFFETAIFVRIQLNARLQICLLPADHLLQVKADLVVVMVERHLVAKFPLMKLVVMNLAVASVVEMIVQGYKRCNVRSDIQCIQFDVYVRFLKLTVGYGLIRA